MQKSSLIWISMCAVLIASCARQSARPEPTPPANAPPAYEAVPGAILANGIVMPARHSRLGFQISGQVREVAVQVGDYVTAGQVLAQLEGGEQLAAAVAAAELELLDAQQALAALKAGAALSVAQAQLEAASAQKELAENQRALRYLITPDVAYYQDQVRQAQEALTMTQASAAMTEPAMAVQQAQQALDDAASALSDAQNLEARYPGGFTQQVKDAQQAYDLAAQILSNAQLRLSQSQIGNASAVADAQKALDAAQASLAGSLQAPEAGKLALAQAQVAAGEAALAQAQAYAAQLQAAGIDGEKLAAAEARLKNAQAQLVAATAALGQAALMAPFTGTVTAVLIQAGEAVGAGAPALELSDLQHWQVETKDIGELAIGKVEIGQPAQVTVNAFQTAELTGTVTAISPTAIVQLGDTTYAVTIDLESTELALRWGMTARVAILQGE